MDKRTIPAKLLAVMDEVSRMDKDGKNQHQGYDFLSEQKVVTTLHAAFAKAGLTIRPVAMELLSEFDYPTKSSTAHGRILRVTYELADADGDTMLVQSIGEGADSGDKATNKAMSAAFKYALRQACMISTGDDPDSSTAIATGSSQRVQDLLDNKAPNCAICGNRITGGTFGGKKRSASEIVDFTTEKFGKPTCATCVAKKHSAKSDVAPMDSLAGGDA